LPHRAGQLGIANGNLPKHRKKRASANFTIGIKKITGQRDYNLYITTNRA